MNLRRILNRLLDLPTVHEEQDVIESRERQAAIERRQRDIERRLEILGYEVDVMRPRRDDHEH